VDLFRRIGPSARFSSSRTTRADIPIARLLGAIPGEPRRPASGPARLSPPGSCPRRTWCGARGPPDLPPPSGARSAAREGDTGTALLATAKVKIAYGPRPMTEGTVGPGAFSGQPKEGRIRLRVTVKGQPRVSGARLRWNRRSEREWRGESISRAPRVDHGLFTRIGRIGNSRSRHETSHQKAPGRNCSTAIPRNRFRDESARPQASTKGRHRQEKEKKSTWSGIPAPARTEDQDCSEAVRSRAGQERPGRHDHHRCRGRSSMYPRR